MPLPPEEFFQSYKPLGDPREDLWRSIEHAAKMRDAVLLEGYVDILGIVKDGPFTKDDYRKAFYFYLEWNQGPLSEDELREETAKWLSLHYRKTGG